MLSLHTGFPALTQIFRHFKGIINSFGLRIFPSTLLKGFETDDIARIRVIPYGAHITLRDAFRLTAAEVTYIGYIIVKLDSTDWTECLAGATGNAQGRGDNYLTVSSDLNG